MQPSNSSVLDDVDAILNESSDSLDASSYFSAASTVSYNGTDSSSGADDGGDPFASYFGDGSGGDGQSAGDSFASFLPASVPPPVNNSFAYPAPPSQSAAYTQPATTYAPAPVPPPQQHNYASASPLPTARAMPPTLPPYAPHPPAAANPSLTANSHSLHNLNTATPTQSQYALQSYADPLQPHQLQQQQPQPHAADMAVSAHTSASSDLFGAASADSADSFSSYFGADDATSAFQAASLASTAAIAQQPSVQPHMPAVLPHTYHPVQPQRPQQYKPAPFTHSVSHFHPPPPPAAAPAPRPVPLVSTFQPQLHSQTRAAQHIASEQVTAEAEDAGDASSYFAAGGLSPDQQQHADDFLSYQPTSHQHASNHHSNQHAAPHEPVARVPPIHPGRQESMSAVELDSSSAASLLSPTASPQPSQHASDNGWLSPSPDASHFEQYQYQQHQQHIMYGPPHATHSQQRLAPPQPTASSGSGRSYPLSSSPTAGPATSSPRSSSVRSPHPIVSFAFGGRMLIMFPQLTSSRPQSAAGKKSAPAAQPMDEFELDNGNDRNGSAAPSASLVSASAGSIRLYSLSSLLPDCRLPELSLLSSFPGPLVAGKSKDKLVDSIREFITRTVLSAEDSSVVSADKQHASEYSRLLWKLLATLLHYQSKGGDIAAERERDIAAVLTDTTDDNESTAVWKHKPVSSSSLPADTFTMSSSSSPAFTRVVPGVLPLPFAAPVSSSSSSNSPHAATTVASSLALHEQRLHQQSVSAYLPVLLLASRKEEAVRLALRHELFVDALLLTADEPRLRAEVVQAVTAKMEESSLTRIHYLVSTGLEQQVWAQQLQALSRAVPFASFADVEQVFSTFPAASTSISSSSTPSIFASWRSHAGMCVSDPSRSDTSFLTHLGDCLWSIFGQPAAAHLCYLLSTSLPTLLSSVPAPSARVVLLGADHKRSLRSFASIGALQCTQLYEYLMQLQDGGKGASVCHQQVYKFVYASLIADVGLSEQALRYCQEILQTVKATQRKEPRDGRAANSAASTSAADGYVYNPLFLYELSILEHRLRVTLNAPASSPVRQKLVSGLFSVLDKGINLLVGDTAQAATANSAGDKSSQSEWGQQGTKWERTFMPQQTGIVHSAGAAQVDGRAPQHSPPGPSPAAQQLAADSRVPTFNLPSAVLPRSSSSSELSAQPPAQQSLFQHQPTLRTSHSGHNLHANSGLPPRSDLHTPPPSAAPASAGNLLTSPQAILPSRPAPALFNPSDAARAHSPLPPLPPTSAPQRPGTAPSPLARHDASGHSPLPHHAAQSTAFGHAAQHMAAPAALSPSHPQPPAATNGTAPPPATQPAGATGPGLLRRLGSVGGLFGMWGGGAAADGASAANGDEQAPKPAPRRSTPGVKEANLDQDHSFRWDEARQKYVFLDAQGNEVVEQEKPLAEEEKPAPPPPLPPHPPRQPAAVGALGMPAMPSGAYYGARPHSVNSRYALSVGETFIAPAALGAMPAYQSAAPALMYPAALPTDSSFPASPLPAAVLYSPAPAMYSQPPIQPAARPTVRGLGVPAGMFNPSAAYQQPRPHLPNMQQPPQ